MDDFINSFQVFCINANKEEFEDSLDEICKKMDSMNDIDDEWKTLRTNYSKLKYLSELVEKYYIPESEKFLETLNKFLYKIDFITSYYLSEINWESETHPNACLIKKYFEDSLQTNDCIHKLKVLLKGYVLLISIVETIRNEKCIEPVNKEFIQEFNFKRRRMG